MKKPLIMAAMALFAACGSNAPAPSPDSTMTKKDSSMAMSPIQSPYPVMYSSSFEMDGPKNAESVLALWKAYDNGNVVAVKDLIADTIEVHLADGLVMRAGRDTIVGMIQSARNTLTAAVDEVDAVMAVKSKDKDEHWALIWGMEKDTHKDGKVDSVYLQETWRFNKDGKADLLYQFNAKSMPAKKK
ncbi:MAG: hypothetical protein JST68_22290 [Bacteroidetes bacterium]|nr:hypothetical protein [Bacteroidota bacterium]